MEMYQIHFQNYKFLSILHDKYDKKLHLSNIFHQNVGMTTLVASTLFT